MEKEYFDALMLSLEDAVAFTKGDTTRGRIVEVEIPDSVPVYKAEDVIRARKSLKLTQSAFAFAIGVSTGTVEAWEAGKNEPSGIANRLLHLLEEDHSLLERLPSK